MLTQKNVIFTSILNELNASNIEQRYLSSSFKSAKVSIHNLFECANVENDIFCIFSIGTSV